ncbi:MAG: hypothetical protein QF790_04360 [Gammaproteobacteria bacterium]|jgi:hypothetical protein|nr:hypothetical protein [Gammaproteobacteria bacterium]MDP6616381.1 hypothetical protein [Gammaproteobacteria bacterium]MDP6695711.1 hypothetical protein [Gammaproteobacteria bacterium]MDP7041112.1 hypothetical protein [Gammaproteobacteria bacterium]
MRSARFSTFLRIIFVCLAALLQACSVSRSVEYDSVDLDTAQIELPSYELLDVGILLFDPAIPGSREEREKKLIFPEVRRAEARYMPFHLKSTLESTGYWGSVWTLPENSDAVDLVIWGRIDNSNGYEANLRLGAWDATGREWLNKNYKTIVPAKAYAQNRDLTQDPYQNIYNEIANDLLAIRSKMTADELDDIRSVARMRFATNLIPDAFATHLSQTRDGRYQVQRLPAEDDPMLLRMEAVREREYMLVDALNEHYAGLYYDLADPYESWRKMSREEAIRYKELKRSARMRQLLGAAAIIGAMTYENKGGSNAAITQTAVIGGIEGISSGIVISAEADKHKDALVELGDSFDAEAEPMVIEVEGQTRRLTGSAEEKYQEWRRILREIYAVETGGVLEQNIAEPDSPVGNAATPD